FGRRLRSACAKYADAFFRISLARRSSKKFSRSSCFEPRPLVCRQPRALAGIPLGLPHPAPERLGPAPDLPRDRGDRPPLTDAPLRARIPAAPPALVPPGKTVLVSQSAPSSQQVEPPGNPGRFTPLTTTDPRRPSPAVRQARVLFRPAQATGES